MPKKFVTENPKAAAARQRKEGQKEAETLKAQQRQEDVYWQDDDKRLMKKQQRKDDHLKKMQEQQAKKAEVKKLEKETESVAKVVKVTRAQISKVSAAGASSAGASSASNKKKKALEVDDAALMKLEENVNRLVLDDGEQARSVDQAILLLHGDNNKTDKHPEKRMKAAHTAFEKRRLKELREENPALRMSQLKEIVWKEWQKAPENPKNLCG